MTMARIYFNCPCSASNGNSLYSLWKYLFATLILIALVVLLTHGIPGYYSFTKSEQNVIDDKNYGIVIDCGSSGSRVFVYYWSKHSGNPQDLLNIQQLLDVTGNAVVYKISPGLSSYEEKPQDASNHIKELLLYVQAFIPEHKHKETFLFVMATAGMRMLPDSAQKAILLDLQTDIKKDFSFVAPEHHFEVISGKQEGVYAWIAINYVLDRFSHSSNSDDDELATVSLVSPGKEDVVTHSRKKTAGIIDMGGGSVQIAFEVTDPDQIKGIPSSLISEFNLGCLDSNTEHFYHVYVTTFLGYGANSARDRYEEMLVKKAIAQEKSLDHQISDVCLPPGMKYDSEIEEGKKVHFIGAGKYADCKAALEPLLNLSVQCPKKPCSFNGVYQPKIDLSSTFYGFSEFWYTMEDVYRIGGHYNYKEFEDKAEAFCKTSWSTLEDWYNQKLYPKADDHRFRFECFKSAWLSDVFHKGLHFPVTFNKLNSAQLVNGKDVGWTLGALIYKTRFLPLRDVQRDSEEQAQVSLWQQSFHLLDSQVLFVICFLVVLAAIVIYMKHLKCCPNSKTLSRVPSMSYFMTEQDQVEQGLSYVKGTGYIV